MYKLIAKLPSGVQFITSSVQIMDLQRIAVNLNATHYQIVRAGDVVYSI